MITFLRKLPIKTQLSIIAISNIVVMLFIIIFSYFKVSDIYQQKNEEYTKEIITQIRQTVSYNCDIINNIVTSIAYNEVIQDYLVESDATKKFELHGKVRNFLGNMLNIKDGIVDIVILGDSGNTFDINGGTGLAVQVADRIPERVNAYYFGIRNISNSNLKTNCFLVGTKIYSINAEKGLNKRIGTLLIFVDTNAVIGKQRNTSKRIGDKIYLLDRDNNIFSNDEYGEETGNKANIFDDISSESSTFNTKFNGEKSIVHTEFLPEIDGKIVSIIPQNKLLYDIASLRNLQLIIFVIGIIILSIPFTIVINNILHPLKKLMEFMNSIKSGHLRSLKTRIDLHGYSEMSIMAQEFNTMLDEIDSLTHRLVESNSKLYEAELEEKQSELGYLRSQINPHFLYNTLESIKGIAMDEGVTKIVDVTKALAQVFRYSVKGEDTVFIEEELNIIKSYVSIQQVRFVDRFEVNYEFSEQILKYKVPKMILQPIVENAIYHGLEIKMEKGHLWIGAEIGHENELVIWVRDDGLGMENETLEEVRKKLSKTGLRAGSKGSGSHGLGISNVNNRIKLTYGDKYGISINSSIGAGTEVLIKLPTEGESYV